MGNSRICLKDCKIGGLQFLQGVEYQYTSKGEYYPNASSPHDLFFVPVKKEGWVNVYKYRSRCTHLSGIIYSSKEEAESDAEVHESGINTYITTIKIEWEE